MRSTTDRVLRLSALAGLVLLASCGDSPTVTDDVTLAPAAEVAAVLPALEDLRRRILPSGGDPATVSRLDRAISELQRELEARRPSAAAAALARAEDALRECADPCLLPPERTVVSITLARVGRVFSREP